MNKNTETLAKGTICIPPSKDYIVRSIFKMLEEEMVGDPKGTKHILSLMLNVVAKESQQAFESAETVSDFVLSKMLKGVNAAITDTLTDQDIYVVDNIRIIEQVVGIEYKIVPVKRTTLPAKELGDGEEAEIVKRGGDSKGVVGLSTFHDFINAAIADIVGEGILGEEMTPERAMSYIIFTEQLALLDGEQGKLIESYELKDGKLYLTVIEPA